jgi:uncharacterized protein (UPF0332 family)
MSVSESQLYLDRAHEDLRAAESNLNQGFYGVAVTRAYYAMFYATSALLASQGIHRSRHTGVISSFSEQFVKTGLIEADYAKMLSHAFDSRLDSDYDLAFVAEQALAQDLWRDAQTFVERAEQYLRQAGELPR